MREKAVAEAPRLIVLGEVRNIVEPHYEFGPPVVGRVDFSTVLAVVGIFLHHVPVHHGEFFFDAFKRKRKPEFPMRDLIVLLGNRFARRVNRVPKVEGYKVGLGKAGVRLRLCDSLRAQWVGEKPETRFD